MAYWLARLHHTSGVWDSIPASALCVLSLHVLLVLRGFPQGTPVISPSPKTCVLGRLAFPNCP